MQDAQVVAPLRHGTIRGARLLTSQVGGDRHEGPDHVVEPVHPRQVVLRELPRGDLPRSDRTCLLDGRQIMQLHGQSLGLRS